MTGFFRQDSDCHWYFIPAKEIDDFDDINRRMDEINTYSEEWENLNDEFTDKYSQYMINSPFEYKVKQIA